MAKKELKKALGKVIGSDGGEIKPPKKTVLSQQRHFRLSEDDAATFDRKVVQSGMTTSEFFREAVIRNKTVVHEKAKIPAINHEVLHLLLKQGNNLNQLARHLNEAKLASTINSGLFADLLSELSEMNKTAKTILGNVKVS